jgi:TolB-like protein
VAPLGKGGMGEVYRARDTRLGRDVALKVVAPELAADAESLRRFEREARALAALAHPNVVPVFDVGVEGAAHYVVTELVEGETVRQRLGAGPFPPAEVIELGAQIAAGLAAAHAKGLVHRDIKPENIILAEGRARILDFGIARQVDAPLPGVRGGDQTVSLTDVRAIVGTPGYMSPEQVRGLPVDARSDIFALGAVLFEMLTGRRAFSGASLVDTIEAVLRSEPDLSSRDVPPPFVTILERCLAKDSEARFRSAEELARELRGASSWDATTPNRPGAPRPATTLAILPFLSLGTEPSAHFGLGLADAVIGRLATARQLIVRPTSAVRRFEDQRADAIEVGRQLGVDRVLEGSVRLSEGGTRVLVHLTDVGRGAIVWSDQLDLPQGRLFEIEDAIAARLVDRLRIKLVVSGLNLPGHSGTIPDRAVERYLTTSARLADARYDAELARALVAQLDSVLEEAPNFAPALAARAYARAFQNYFAPGLGGAEGALRDADQARSLDPELPLPHVARALVLWSAQGGWKFAEAVHELRTAIVLSPGSDIPHLELARIFHHWGWVTEAGEEVQEVRRIDPLSTDLARMNAYLSWIDGRHREALDQYHRLSAERSRGMGGRLEVLQIRLQLGEISGTLEEIEAWVREQPADKLVLALLALVRTLTGKGETSELEQRILATRREAGHFHHVLFLLAEARAQRGDTQGAVELLRQASETGLPCLTAFDTDPLLSPIHGTPEYAALRADVFRKAEEERARLRLLDRLTPAQTR